MIIAPVSPPRPQSRRQSGHLQHTDEAAYQPSVEATLQRPANLIINTKRRVCLVISAYKDKRRPQGAATEDNTLSPLIRQGFTEVETTEYLTSEP